MRIAIMAGEASGDLLGAELMSGLPEVEFQGIGGEEMIASGLTSLFPMRELSVMGIGEVLPRLPSLLRRIKQAQNFVTEGDFDALITIDSPDFSFRVAKKVKKIKPNLPIIHYVAPSVWAWRAGRAKKISRFVDHVLCLLPFEPELMRNAGMSADFVGHPVMRIAQPSEGQIKAWQDREGKVLGLFPGSRRSEIERHLPVFLDAISKSKLNHKVMMPLHAHLLPLAQSLMNDSLNIEILASDHPHFQREKSLIMHGADLALATSGTVSFELSAAQTPMIVGYNANWLTAFLMKRLVKTRYASLTNILLDKEVIPEFLFENFTADKIADALEGLNTHEDWKADQLNGFTDMKTLMISDFTASESVKRFLKF